MEARSSEHLTDTDGPWQYEPKWDGFRCLAFKSGDTVAPQFVVDGELVIELNGQLAFDGKRQSVKSNALAECGQLLRRAAGMFATSPANMDAKLARERREAALQRADHTGGDAGRMPVHSHDRAKRLEPEWVRQTLQELGASVVVNNRLADDGAKRGHALH